MADGCADDHVRRYPPAPPPAGAGAPPLSERQNKKEAVTAENAQPAQVDPAEGSKSRVAKARDHAPPGLSGPEAGPAS